MLTMVGRNDNYRPQDGRMNFRPPPAFLEQHFFGYDMTNTCMSPTWLEAWTRTMVWRFPRSATDQPLLRTPMLKEFAEVPSRLCR